MTRAASASRRFRHRCSRSPIDIFPPDKPCEVEFNRGELRLAAEVLITQARGGFVPALVHVRAMRTIERLGE